MALIKLKFDGNLQVIKSPSVTYNGFSANVTELTAL